MTHVAPLMELMAPASSISLCLRPKFIGELSFGKLAACSLFMNGPAPLIEGLASRA
ncbi:hypothetical protein [Roseinatronobacter thiooxidans]|uniref:hypothetical protein n=1 Tax=Roseinatronobacter thiooxidans TaxID=121821 RepID=UPI001475FC19|nr:hypothetical protein [Roseinatronobacter thiooxidans]